jgi:hypothetical protein
MLPEYYRYSPDEIGSLVAMPIVELYEHAADSKSKSRRRVALAPMISCHPAPRALHAGETDDEYRTSLGELYKDSPPYHLHTALVQRDEVVGDETEPSTGSSQVRSLPSRFRSSFAHFPDFLILLTPAFSSLMPPLSASPRI